MTPKDLRRRILAEIEPSPARTREAKRLAARLARDLRREALARGLRVQPKLVGSLAKDTHLANPLDVDVFVLFSPTTPRSVLEKQGVALGKAVLRKPVLRYAEHPYVHGRVGDIDVDVVPAYKLPDPTGKLSAVDRTPFHTDFVRKRATARHRREIRLLKRFLRGIGCYGAETAVGGVSGYLAELLVLEYGTFDKTVDAIARWRPPVLLALDGKPSPMGGSLVFIDPVDPSRNAAAAVHADTLDRMQRAARAYKKRPSQDFFFPPQRKPFPPERLRRLLSAKPTLGIETPRPAGAPETVRPQAQRLAAKFARHLEEEGFRTVRKGVHETEGGRILVLLQHAPSMLPPTFEHRGPRAADEAHVERFLARWRNAEGIVAAPKVRGDRWTVEVRRDLRSPADFLNRDLALLLRGFEFEKGEPRILAGESLLEDPRRHEALTVFLRRLDPWRR